MRALLRRFSLLGLALLAGCSGSQAPPTSPGWDPAPRGEVVLLEDFTGRQVFPRGGAWSLDVSEAPVDAASAAYIDFLSSRAPGDTTTVRRLGASFGPPTQGIPYIGVAGSQALVPVHFTDYPGESDAGAPGRPAGYPIPDEAKWAANHIQGGAPGGGPSGDRHMIVVDRDRWLLFETFATRWNAAESRWEAACGAVYDLSAEPSRPDGWTSADAAGLPIFPGLVRYDEVASGEEIRHAFRVVARASDGRVWPAKHVAGTPVPGALPFGARLRLKSSVALDSFPPDMQRIFRAMQRYGLIVADHGPDMSVIGTMDPRWDNPTLFAAFSALTADDFEVVQLGWGRPE